MRTLIVLALLALWLPSQGTSAVPSGTSFTQQLDAMFDAPMWRNAHWGVKIVDLTTSEMLYEREADKGFMPASNMKLYTTAAALHLLGPDYRYETSIYATGPITESGTLMGDLLIVGSGDPSISGRYDPVSSTTTMLRNWAEAVRKAGIRRVEGAVIGDDNCFDDEYHCGTWQLDYIQEWYAAETSGLSMNENCWDAVIRPGTKVGDPAIVESVLPTRYYTIVSEVTTTEPLKAVSDETDITLHRPMDSNVVTIKGTIPLGTKEYMEWGSLRNGTLYCASLFAEELERQGIHVIGGPADIDDVRDPDVRIGHSAMKLVHTHVSPPMSRLIQIVNKPSQNFYAEQLLKTLGRKYKGAGSFKQGEQVVKDFLTSAGIASANLRMADGSGLSRQDLVEPQMTMGILQFMHRQPEFKAFYDSLPIAGIDGTIKSRMRGTAAEGNLHAKTGTINRVRSLSGYVTRKDGHLIAFCTMANNYLVDTKHANDVQDKLAMMLIEQGQ